MNHSQLSHIHDTVIFFAGILQLISLDEEHEKL